MTDDELLAAWLAGDLDAGAATALEARMDADETLAARADRLADLAGRLRGLDEVDPPDGFSARLRQRLDTERTVPSIDARRRRAAPWQALGAVAAALIGVVALGGVLGGLGIVGGGNSGVTSDTALDTGGEEAAEEAEAPAALSAGTATDADAGGDAVEDAATAAPEAETAERASEVVDDAAEDGGDTGGSPEQADPATAAAGPAPGAGTGPSVADSQVALADETAVRAHLDDVPVAGALLGTPVEDADTLAASYRTAIQRAEPFADGVRPDACLDAVAAGAAGPLVPAAAESVTYAGQPALLYVLVDASAGATALDRVTAWVVDPERCATRLFVDLE